MPLITVDDSKLRQFLLGELTSNDFEEVGLYVISDPESEDKLTAAEHALVEDYLEGTLSNHERALFEANFARSERRLKLVRELSNLKKYSKEKSRDSSPLRQGSEDKVTFWRTIKDWYRAHLSVATALSIGIFIVAGWFAWMILVRNSPPPTALELEYSKLNKANFENLETYQDSTIINLVPGTFRDTAPTTTFGGQTLSNRVLFRLALPRATGSETFDTVVSRNGQTVFSQTNLRSYDVQGARELRFLLPNEVLTPGQYQIKLKQQSSESEGPIYQFSIK